MIPTEQEMYFWLEIARILFRTDFITIGDVIGFVSYDDLIKRDMPWNKFTPDHLLQIADTARDQETTDRATDELISRTLTIAQIIELLGKTKKPPQWEKLAEKLFTTPMSTAEMIKAIEFAKEMGDLEGIDSVLAGNIKDNGFTGSLTTTSTVDEVLKHVPPAFLMAQELLGLKQELISQEQHESNPPGKSQTKLEQYKAGSSE